MSFEHVYRFCPDSRVLEYVGTGLRFVRFVGPGRPEGGHLQPIPQIKLSPAPNPETLPIGQRPIVVILDGPFSGRSRSGLSVYGEPATGLSSAPLGKGHILFAEGPVRIVTMERPTGSRREAHLAADYSADAADMAGLPVMWRCGDATSAVYLCGWPRTRTVQDYPVEEIWLPTREERRIAERTGPCWPVLDVLHGYRLRQQQEPRLPIPPWDQEAGEELAEAVRCAMCILARHPRLCATVGWSGVAGQLAEAVGISPPSETALTEGDAFLSGMGDVPEHSGDAECDEAMEAVWLCAGGSGGPQRGWAREAWDAWADGYRID
jgi:hypothetical protein